MKINVLPFLLFAACFLFHNGVYGQSTIKKWTENYLGVFNYNIEWEEDKNEYKFKLIDKVSNESQEFSNFKPFDEEVFLTDYQVALKKIIPDSISKLPGSLHNEAIEVLEKVTPSGTSSYKPKAGDMKINEEVPIALFSDKWERICLETKQRIVEERKKDTEPKVGTKREHLLDALKKKRSDHEDEHKIEIERLEGEITSLQEKVKPLKDDIMNKSSLIEKAKKIMRENVNKNDQKSQLKHQSDSLKRANVNFSKEMDSLSYIERTVESNQGYSDEIKELESKIGTFDSVKTDLENHIDTSSEGHIELFLSKEICKLFDLSSCKMDSFNSTISKKSLTDWKKGWVNELRSKKSQLEQSKQAIEKLNLPTTYKALLEFKDEISKKIESLSASKKINESEIGSIARQTIYFATLDGTLNYKEIDAMLGQKLEEVNSELNSIIDDLIKGKKALESSLQTNIAEQKRKQLEIDNILPQYTKPFIVDSVEIEFYEGFIENIWAIGHIKGENKILKFENQSPIPYSNKKAYERRKNVYLIASDTASYWTLYLGDLIEYYLQRHQNEAKDFSPANGTVHWTSFDEVKSLYKESTAKLFEAHVFSDFVGFDKDAPNGLIQTEISKRFNLYTRRFGSFLSKNAVYCKCRGPKWGANWGFFNFLKVSFVFSKFEEKKRSFQLNVQNRIINAQLRSVKYASTQKILQHEIFNIGARLNLVTFDIPLAISIIYLNGGFAYGRTEVTDSIYAYNNNVLESTRENNFGINSIRLFSEIVYKITPQKRYGFETSIRFIWFKGFTDQTDPFLQLNEERQINENNNYDKVNQWLIRFQLLAYFKPDKGRDNRLFFRYRFNGQLADFDYNFHQLQIGYSFYLTRNNLSDLNGPNAELMEKNN